MSTPSRPVSLDLLKIQFPVTAVTSLLHRVSGVILAISVPFWIYLLQLSLQNETTYLRLGQLLSSFWVRLWIFICLWALLHHLLSGIRFLLVDLDVGVDKVVARTSAWVVNLVTIFLLLLLFGMLF